MPLKSSTDVYRTRPGLRFGMRTLLAMVALFAAVFASCRYWQQYRVLRALMSIKDTPGVTVKPDSTAFVGSSFNRQFFRNKKEFQGDSGAVALSKIVRDEKQDAALRNLATYVIYEIGPEAKAAIPILVDALSDKEQRVRSQAAFALAGIGPYAVPAIMAALEQGAEVRKWGINALSKIGPGAETAIPVFLEALNDADSDTRLFAVDGLATVAGDPAAFTGLVGALKHDDGYVRGWAAMDLGRLGPDAQRAIPAIAELCNDQHEFARSRATEALKRIDPDAVPKATGHPHPRPTH